MQVEVDQSGKIENTKHATVVSLAGKGYQIALRLKAKDKRLLILSLRKNLQKPQRFYLNSFCALVALAVAKSGSIGVTTLNIDKEYFGKDSVVALVVRRYCRVLGGDTSFDINSINIGKKSPAHKKALAVFRGKDKDFVAVSVGEVLRLVLQKKKSALV